MKKTSLLVSLPAVIMLAASVNTVEAATQPSASSMTVSSHAKTIYFNQQKITQAYAVVANGTTYMPLWYIQYALQSIGVSSKWMQNVWSLQVPSIVPVNDSHLPQKPKKLSPSTVVIRLNQKTVDYIPGLVHVDPASGQAVEFVPIWYVSQVLQRFGVQSEWNGKSWYLSNQASSGVTVTSTTSSKSSESSQSSQSKQTTSKTGNSASSTSGSASSAASSQQLSDNQSSSTPPIQMVKKTISFSGNVISTPYSFVENGTTYMPLWYVGQALKAAGIAGTWKPGEWSLQAPSNMTAKLSNLPSVPKTLPPNTAIVKLNGQAVLVVPTSVQVDPDSNSPTTYVPIWYIQQVLKRVNLQTTWNGSEWSIPAPSATSPSSSGTSSKSNPSGSSQGNSSPDPSTSANGSTSSGSGSSGDPQGGSSSTPSSSNGTDPSSSSSGTSNNSASNDPIIAQFGDTGQTVQLLQNDLNIVGDNVGPVDGIFGPMTEGGVKAFQQSAGLPVTGIVDQTTWQQLQVATLQAEEKNGFQFNNNPPPSSNTSGSSSSAGGTSSNTGSSSTSANNGPSFTNVDLRFPAPSDVTASSIDSYLSSNGSPMTGLGTVFMQAQNTYGVDANYLVSHAILESAWGKSQIALAKNNLFGYGAYDSNPGNDAGMFPSEAYAIRFQAWEVRNNYLDPSGSLYVSPTLTGMNVNYATDPNWATDIGNLMNQFATSLGSSVNDYVQYTPNDNPPQPASTTEPVFLMNGAVGKVVADPDYNGLPYYSSMGEGESNMFFGTLSEGSFGSNVASVQEYLNQVDNANLTVDGQFGPDTQAAVDQFEQSHNLPVNGQWDYSMWAMFNPAPPQMLQNGATVQVEEMKQGMTGGIVTEWYDLAGYGWVDSNYIQLQNVYRITVPDPTSTNTEVTVYNASNPSQVLTQLHAGNFVVCNNPAPNSQGYITIQFANQLTGQMETGLISTNQASLTQQQ
ncbi:peptidoglycan-binding protein [Alicyclobacillus tolerans]|uniref:Putative peptidoglycan binding domain-containing protein n=1 Tax=Alicyclobacillus tolerans TaxID=90970 RepID=A0A1M6MZT0_9BACL|nr:peptidoglycan-binding protein [Alicyclobacillus montanus]SHJ88924.1 Putative peptidoglycan binding domain-containing protein [Alicyclobacillus montanus]